MLDLVIRGGKILDGMGAPARDGEICIRAERIAYIGPSTPRYNSWLRTGFAHGEAAARIIDVDGLTIAPGFIDVHSHADGLLLSKQPDDSKVAQGVTSEITGNCGFTVAPVNPQFRDLLISYGKAIMGDVDVTWTTFREYLTTLEAARPPINVGALVGHGAVRTAAMGFEMRQAKPAELERMRVAVAEAMEAGALGLSTGLIYPPGTWANTEEVVELARVVKKYGGLYASHIRDEAKLLIQAMQEAIHIGEAAGVPVQISHCKVSGSANWGKSAALVGTIHEARARGLDVTGDQYPYLAGSTGLRMLLPPWAHEGGMPETIGRLRSPEMRAKLRHDMEHGVGDWWNPSRNTTWDGILIASSPYKPDIEGKSMEQLAREANQDPFETLFDVLEQTQCTVVMIIFIMSEADVKTIMRDPQIMIGTDALTAGSKPHPRAYGTYPRILGKYVREEHVLALPEAIRKMTSMPAQKFGLKGRGVIREGAYADLVIFDPQSVIDMATYEEPIQYPKGMPYVIVNGVMGVDDGRVTGARAGQVLRRVPAG